MLTLLPPDPTLPSAKSTRRRPHYYPGGATYVIGMRLAGSVTRPAIRRLRELVRVYGRDIPPHLYWEATAEERVGFRKLRAGLDSRRDLNGPFHLHHSEACRRVLLEAVAFREGAHYETIALSVMPNHVHWVVRHRSRELHMGELLYRLRKFTGRRSNEVLGLTGQPYWEREGYDHVVRTQRELAAQVRYTLHNPVACRLCEHWADWPGNYLHPGWRTRDGRRGRVALG